MSQRGKQWLAWRTLKTETLDIVPDEGGFAGSLVHLGYIRPLDDQRTRFAVTPKGLAWCRNVRRKLLARWA